MEGRNVTSEISPEELKTMAPEESVSVTKDGKKGDVRVSNLIFDSFFEISEQLSSNVEHPSHYNQGGYEVVKVLEVFGFDKDAYIFQSLVCLFRAPFKGQEKEDYEKAIYYINLRLRAMKKTK